MRNGSLMGGHHLGLTSAENLPRHGCVPKNVAALLLQTTTLHLLVGEESTNY